MLISLVSSLFSLCSCSGLTKPTEHKNQLTATTRPKRAPAPKKLPDQKNSTNELSGTLANGTRFEVTNEEEGHVVSFEPYLAKNDDLFTKAANQIIAKIFNDKISDESHISIETDIDYTIFKGEKARYRIVPFKESSGEISSISITSII